jgi:hypothetical protein
MGMIQPAEKIARQRIEIDEKCHVKVISRAHGNNVSLVISAYFSREATNL